MNKGSKAAAPKRTLALNATGLVTLPVLATPAELQRCSRCRLRKPRTSFNRNRSGRQAYCRPCFRDYFRARGQKHRDQSERARLKRRAVARKLVEERLASGCVDCGELDPFVLECDHVGGKSDEIAKMVWEGRSVERVKRELDACEVVCVNCHKRRTFSRMERCWRVNPRSLETAPGLSRLARRNLIFIRGWLTISACTDCGLDDLVVLEFDHLRDKRGEPTIMARNECSLQRLRDEVAKCQIRCGNCHRHRTRRLRTPPTPRNLGMPP